MRGVLITIAAIATASPLAAHSLAECDGRVAGTAGGAGQHEDMGRGKIAWTEWWDHEGVYRDVWLADCRTGIAMSLRTREERISERFVPDRTAKVRAELTRQAQISPALFTVERMAGLVRRDGRDLMIAQYDDEVCGCHAAYPELRGAKAEFGGHS